MNDYNFKPFDKVLVRADGYNKWLASFYSHYDKEKNVHICTNGAICTDCIPYEGNKHLLGTTDEPKTKRWRAKKGEQYWYLNYVCECFEANDDRCFYDDNCYNIGNYFRTKEEAEEMAVKFKQMLKGGEDETQTNTQADS